MKNLLTKLSKLANKLDEKGLYDEADAIDKIIMLAPRRMRMGPGRGLGRGLGICPLEDIDGHINKLKGGVGDKLTEEDVDPKELEMGIKVEMEHTKDPETAKDISFDHLEECENYYSRLKEMEEECEKEEK